MKYAFLHSIYTFIVIGLLSFVFFNLSALDMVDKAFKDFSYLDLFQSKKIFKNEQVSTDIILVNIERKNRSEIAFLLNHIANQQPKTIGLDAIFNTPKDIFGDSLLADAIDKNRAKIVSSHIYPAVKNLAQFNSDQTGFINLNLAGQEDKVIRNFVGEYENNHSFAYEIAKKYDSNLKIDYNLKQVLPIKYFGNLNQFLHFSYADVMQQAQLPFFKDKIILLGYLGTPLGSKFDIEDKHFTPINENFAGKSIPDMYGITIHANIINMLLTNNFITPTPSFLVYLLSFIAAFLSALLFMKIFKKEYPWYGVIVKIYQFGSTFLVLWLSLLLFKGGIKFPVLLLISSIVLSVELVVYFDYLYKYLHKKWNIKNIYA
ncbi:CHASE2 domain-containing protein [Polaribacter sp.]|uniref:CHASE2 domain-containing protein n=1 Tax=Polaribacter sp. TaxID=1920175 RepID=UPI003EF922CA